MRGKFILFIVYCLTLGLILNLSIVGCSSKSSSTSQILSIGIKPSQADSAVGLTMQFTATALYSNGTTKDITSQVTWNSSDMDVATISPSGLANCVTIGSTHITASLSGIISPPDILAVRAPALSSISISPAISVKLSEGATQQFTATGIYSDGTTADITSQVTWIRSNTSVATVSSTGLAAAIGNGTVNISATLSGIVSPLIPLTVISTTPALSSIVITPGSPLNLTIGASLQFTANGTYSDGTTADITNSVTWTSDTPIAATITQSGLAYGVAAGTADITATMSGVNSQPEVLTVVAATSAKISP